MLRVNVRDVWHDLCSVIYNNYCWIGNVALNNTAQIQLEKILVIGSELNELRILSGSLKSNTLQVDFEESNFQNILYLLDQYRPSLLMLYNEKMSVELDVQLQTIQEHYPLPIILQLGKESEGDVERCLSAGVSVFLSGEVNYQRMPSIVNTALVRYQQSAQHQKYTEKLERQLSQRKIIAKAKGLLMDKNGLTENEAYEFLRTTAMKNNQSMAELSEKIIDRH